MKSPTIVEKIIDQQANRILQHMPSHGIAGALVEFLVFGLKQAWACLFGGAILVRFQGPGFIPDRKMAGRGYRQPNWVHGIY